MFALLKFTFLTLMQHTIFLMLCTDEEETEKS